MVVGHSAAGCYRGRGQGRAPLAADPQCSTDNGRAKGANAVWLSLTRSALVAGAIALAGASCVVAEATQGEAQQHKLGAFAAVIHHVASGIVGEPPQLTYLAYKGKPPSTDPWKLVSDINHLRPMPPSWKPNVDDAIELLDVYDVRRGKSAALEMAVQTVGPVGLAVEACIYTARPKGNSWQVDSQATRCLVL